jgi:hypothetical protein
MLQQEMIMATLRVKARIKPTEGAQGKVNQNPATLTRDSPVQQKGGNHKAAVESPASCGAPGEYPNTAD